MVEAATAALRATPSGSGERTEIAQWQADGLRQLLSDAQQRGDWPAAVALLDQMAALPESPFSPEVLAEERRVATVLQALTLLEAGQMEAALELAGDDLLDSLPSRDIRLLSLFDQWGITAQITPAGTRLHVRAGAAPEPGGAGPVIADALFGEFLDHIRSESLEISGTEMNKGDSLLLREPMPLEAYIYLEDRQEALTLAQQLDPGPHWVFLRTFLEQLAPIVQYENRNLSQTIAIEQSLDLREAGTQWTAMAESLEQRAEEIELRSRGVNVNDPVAIEEALRLRIEAANYRSAAKVWRELAVRSSVRMRLAADQSEEGQTWLATSTTPAQTFTYQTEARNDRRIAMAGGAVLAILLMISALLWRLL
jgi:hypothetical protein